MFLLNFRNRATGSSLRDGVDRREFIKFCTMGAAAIGLPASAAFKMAEAAVQGKVLKPSVIWLHFQECTGCTETLLRTSHPGLAEVVLDLISLDYHETVMVAAGHQAEDARRSAMNANAGKYVLVVEGAIPTKEGGIYCKVGGQTALEMLQETADKAAAIIAIGSCASFGGIPAADPNPTEARGVPQILTKKTVVTIPGCPPNPYTFLGTVLQFATLGKLPALDAKGRPMFAFARTIHEDCPRRAHFDAGRFAEVFGDEGHRNGYCLYKLGCKGPQTHASCSIKDFSEIGAWPIGIGHPCVGCTEQEIAFRVPIHTTIPVQHLTPPDTYAALHPERKTVSPIATGVAGALGGALLTAGYKFSKKLSAEEAEQPPKDKEV
jgi:hydrogenase small subunit